MPSLSAVKASNQAWRPAFRPVVVGAGGTNGIGAGIATTLAKHSPKNANAPYIILVGRNRQNADAVIERMKNVNSTGKYEFVQGDLTLMKGIRSVAAEISGKVDRTNFLCMSQGMATLEAKDDTEEGVDKKLALHFYSRFLLTNPLLPKLEKAADQGEEARVITILSAGKGGNVDLDDLGVRNVSGTLSNLVRKASAAGSYNDLMVEELGIRHPKLSFTHAYPGFVDTNLASGLPVYLRAPAALFRPLAVSADNCGENMVYNLFRPQHKTGSHFVSEQGDEAKKSQYYGNNDTRAKVWKHALDITGWEDKI